MADDYATDARFYDDAYAVKADLSDVPFYTELVTARGGAALEIACGTGRVLLEIAKRGVAIDGVDASPAMLGVLENKLRALAPDVRARVRVTRADMRAFSLGRTYRTVILPFRPFQHLYTVDDQVAALRTARAHLEPGGQLALDVFFPNMAALADADIGRERHELTWTDSADSSVRVERYFVRETLDPVRQVFEGRFLFRRYRGDTLLDETTSPLKMSYYTYPHMLALFRLAALEVVAEFGSFQGEPMDARKDMIFVLRAS